MIDKEDCANELSNSVSLACGLDRTRSEKDGGDHSLSFGILVHQVRYSLPSLSKVYSMVTQEEKEQAVASSRAPVIEATALAAKTGNSNLRFNQSNSRPRERCDHCKKTGHTKERCFEIIGYPANWRPRGRTDQTKASIPKSSS